MKRFMLLLLSLSCAITAATGMFLTPAEEIKECSNVFSSGIYAAYRNNIKEFVKSRGEEGREWVVLLEEEPTRQSHEKFIHHLRKAVANNPNGMVQELVAWIYSQVNLNSEMESFLEKEGNIPSFSELLTAQEKLKIKYNGVPKNKSYKDRWLLGNLPSQVFTLQGTNVIRMGCPLIEEKSFFTSRLRPSPEFSLFISNQPCHLYVNLMKRRGEEGPYTSTLESLEKEFPHLRVITLDKDSLFYWQKATPDLVDATKFKKQFLKKLTASHGNFFWSGKLDKNMWTDQLKMIINNVSKTHFTNKNQLTIKERQDFIELSYLSILNILQKTLTPASMNITCKEGIDRGPSLLVLWMYSHHLAKEKEASVLLLSPPLLIHNRTSHASRLERLISASRYL